MALSSDSYACATTFRKPAARASLSDRSCYNALARHPDLAWISQASKKFPRSLLLTRLIMAVRSDRRPTEGHRIWRRFVRAEDDSLGREHVTPAACRYYTSLVAMHVRLHGKPRFLSKHPRNVLRFPFLDEIFPDAKFLHLIRDGRAVAQSLLRMRESHGGRNVWWGIWPPGWRVLERLDAVESVARQWRATIEHARKSAALFSSDRYLEVRYEDFCADPVTTLGRVGRWAGLSWADPLLVPATAGIESRNHKWQDAFRPEEIAVLESTMGDLLRRDVSRF